MRARVVDVPLHTLREPLNGPALVTTCAGALAKKADDRARSGCDLSRRRETMRRQGGHSGGKLCLRRLPGGQKRRGIGSSAGGTRSSPSSRTRKRVAQSNGGRVGFLSLSCATVNHLRSVPPSGRTRCSEANELENVSIPSEKRAVPFSRGSAFDYLAPRQC